MTRTCPGSALAAVEGMALRTEREEHHVVDEGEGAAQGEGEDGGHRHHQDAGQHDQRAAPALAVPGAEQRQHGEGPGGELHGRGDAERPRRTRTGRCRWASTMASNMKATTGMSSPPVANGSAARGRMISAWTARILRRPGARHRYRATAATAKRGEAEEDTGVAQPAVGPDVARDAGQRHDGQVGQEAGVVGLARRVVRHLVVEALDLAVRVRPLDQVLAAHLDRWSPRAGGGSRERRRSATGSRGPWGWPGRRRRHRRR